MNETYFEIIIFDLHIYNIWHIQKGHVFNDKKFCEGFYEFLKKELKGHKVFKSYISDSLNDKDLTEEFCQCEVFFEEYLQKYKQQLSLNQK